jgi:tetratricopeptide (TPR) repeat protein
LKYINEAIEISKDVFNAYIIRVQIFEKFNEIKNALKDLDFLIKENPEKIGLYYFRADLFRLEKNYEFAIADYSVAIKKIESSNEQFPDDILHYFYRGYSYYCIFRYDRAIKDFEKALEIDPEHYASYMNMGLCYRDLKDYNTALEKITKAIDLKPDYDLGLMNRAILFTEYLHQFDKALEDLFKYKEMFGDKQPRVDFYIILCYIEKKEFLKAKPIAEKLLKFITQDPELHYFYAKILQSIGLENDSKKHIEKSITINPDFEKIIKDDPKLSKLLKKRKFFFK